LTIHIAKVTLEWLTIPSHVAKLTPTVIAVSSPNQIQSYNSLPVKSCKAFLGITKPEVLGMLVNGPLYG
jgi:hypothetical protein